MDLGIAGKWALVCGASKGLGLGCAQALAGEGVNLLMVARGESALAQAAAEIRAAGADRAGVSVESLIISSQLSSLRLSSACTCCGLALPPVALIT